MGRTAGLTYEEQRASAALRNVAIDHQHAKKQMNKIYTKHPHLWETCLKYVIGLGYKADEVETGIWVE